ncbi:hypothetical protein PQX77_002729 [Marasmius sp. AFHP31]|nr:hypothetical protein PQX77_002729 [Marasmius sp. AFHP31]
MVVAHWFGESDVPLTTDLLQSDVLLRFAATLKSVKVDRYAISFAFPSSSADASVRVSQPTVISKLTNTPIAVANNAWESFNNILSDRKVLRNGLTRFTLAYYSQHLSLHCNGNADGTWKSQAWSIFHSRGITLEDDLSVYHFIYPHAMLYDRVRYPEAQLERQSQQPIYLFVRPPPSNLGHHRTSSLHYWSFHKDGRSPLSPDTCRSLGLPIKLGYYHSFFATSWSNEDYQRLHQYQLLRGFDPSTTDFARHLEWDKNLFQPVNDSDRFEILRESPPKNRSSTPTSEVSDKSEDWTSTSDLSEDSEEFTLIEPILAPTTSATQLSHTEVWSPALLPLATEVSSELATTMESLNLDVN